MALGTPFVSLPRCSWGVGRRSHRQGEGVWCPAQMAIQLDRRAQETWWREDCKPEMCWCGGAVACPPSRAPLPAVARGCSRLGAAELCLSLPPQLRSQAQEVGGNVTTAAFPPHALQHCPPSLPG